MQGEPPHHEHSHLNDRIGTVLFAFAIFFVTVFLFNLKKIVRTVIIEDLIVAFSKQVAVLIHFRLDKIAFISQDIECPIYIMQLIRRLFQKFRSCLIGRTFTGWFKDPGIDKVGKNRIDIIFEAIFVPELSTGLIKLKPIVKSLGEKISATVEDLFAIIPIFDRNEMLSEQLWLVVPFYI